MVMKTQLVKIVTMMKTLNNVFVLRKKWTIIGGIFSTAMVGRGDNCIGDNVKDMNE